MSFQTWLLFIVVSVLPVMSPGPAILLAVSNSLRYGPRSTYYSGVGNALGVVVLGFAVAFGLAAIVKASAIGFTVLKLGGAAYLFYLGVKVWRNEDMLALEGLALDAPKSPRRLFIEAFFLALTNPKGLIFLAALLPPFVDHQKPIVPQVAVLSVTFASLCLMNHLFLAHAAGQVRRWLTSKRRMLAVRRCLGGLFMGFAGALALMTR